MKTFRQADSRWGSHKYPSGGYTMANSGCGCTAVADIVSTNPKYSKYTPDTIRPYMIKEGFATRGHGTTWNGIRKTLEHYGFVVANPDTMTELFKLLEKGVYKYGVLLFGKGSRGGITWTAGGHYVAYSNYKVVNGKHYLYTHDPGGRHHDGWYCYETQMKGLVKNVWCCYLKDDKKDKTVTVTTNCIDISAYQGVISVDTFKKMKSDIPYCIIRSGYTSQSKFKMYEDKCFKKNIVNAHKAGMGIGIYHYSQATTVEEARKEAQFVLKTIAKYKSYITLPVAFDWEFGGRLSASKAKSNGKTKNGKICNAFCSIINSAGYIAMVYANLSTLNNYLPDDLYKSWKIWVAQYNTTCDYKHKYYLWQYTSSAKVSGISGNVDMSKTYPVEKTSKGEKYTGTFPTLPSDGYLKVGKKGKNVEYLQKFLIWAGYSVGSAGADGKFGSKTEQAVIDFQTDCGLVPDGLFGKKSLAAAKAYTK